MYNGVLNINKPKGYTSHDVVNKVRRIAGMKKVGHTGTLDPMAEGVLPVCLGKATRIAEYLTGEDKEYIAEVTLGAETDTLDSEGNIIKECPVPELGQEDLQNVFAGFVGEILQIPPLFSAIKKDGKPLYKYAREGKTIDIPSRKVEIKYIELISWEKKENRFQIKVGCSKGTYIRSLARDLGSELGTCAHLTSLKRTKSGSFLIESSVSFEDLERDGVEKYIVDTDRAIPDFSSVKLDEHSSKKASLGNFIVLEEAIFGQMENQENIKIFSNENVLIGLGIIENGVLKPKKVFV
jgi:tRNA pseudouridine55 synthase